MTFNKFLMATATTSLIALGSAQALSNEAKDIIGKTAVQYLKSNPQEFEGIIDSVQEYAKKEQEKAQASMLDKHLPALFDTTKGRPFMGNKDGSIEVAVFMDPFCQYCRKFEETLHAAVKQNKDLKVVAIDIGILHPKSEMLVKATIAAFNQGKYAEMQALVHETDPTVTEEDVFKMAEGLKLDMAKFKADFVSKESQAIFESNMTLGEALDARATPTVVFKNQKKIQPGYIPLEPFLEMLKK